MNPKQVLADAKRNRRAFEFWNRAGSSNVVSVAIGIDQSGKAYVHSLSAAQVRDEVRRFRAAYFYRLTMRPVANDNEPAPEASLSPGMHTRLSTKGKLAKVLATPWLCIREGAWADYGRAGLRVSEGAK